MNQQQKEEALALIRRAHGTQTRANGLPVWHHVARVSFLLESILERYQEGDAKERAVIALSALGHDLLEDTSVTESEIREMFGDRGYELIWGMTNEQGDDDVAPYVKKVVSSEEAVRLIKCADMIDNINDVAYNIPTLGTEWVTSFFIRVVEPMKDAILNTKFAQYPKTGAEFLTLVRNSYALLDDEVQRCLRENV